MPKFVEVYLEEWQIINKAIARQRKALERVAYVIDRWEDHISSAEVRALADEARAALKATE